MKEFSVVLSLDKDFHVIGSAIATIADGKVYHAKIVHPVEEPCEICEAFGVRAR